MVTCGREGPATAALSLIFDRSNEVPAAHIPQVELLWSSEVADRGHESSSLVVYLRQPAQRGGTVAMVTASPALLELLVRQVAVRVHSQAVALLSSVVARIVRLYLHPVLLPHSLRFTEI